MSTPPNASLRLSKTARLLRLHRAQPCTWVRHRIQIDLAHQRSRAELLTWLSQQPPTTHAWCRQQLAQGKLQLDGRKSYQGEALDAMAKPGWYAFQWCNGAAKTTTAALLAHWFLDCYPGSRVLTTSGTFSQLKEQLWREIASWAARAKGTIASNCAPHGIGKTQIDIAPDWAAIARAADKGPTFEGVHAGHVMVLMDEAKAINQEIFDAVRRILRGNPDAAFWWVCLSSPGSPTGPFWEITNGGEAHRWQTFRLSAYETERINLAQIDKDAQDLGESSPLFVSMDLGEFPEEGEDTVIPLSWVQAAVNRPVNSSGELLLGVDVARFGGDWSALVSLTGRRARIEDVYHGKATTWTVGRIAELQEQHGFARVGVDDSGVGGGVTDQLRDTHIHVRPVNFGSTEGMQHPDRYVNVKAEMYFNLRSEFEAGFREPANADAGLSIPDDRRLIHQLTMQKFRFDARQRYLLESHAEVKARGEQSPDLADALAIANWMRRKDLSKRNTRLLELNREARHRGLAAAIVNEEF